MAIRSVSIDSISPSPHQPRTNFDEEALRQLAASITASGLLQPILVRPIDGGRYVLVAGERRWRAARLAGLAAIPAIVRELDNQTAAEWSLVENVQRADLNAVERATALRRLGEEFGLSHREIAERVGLDRSSVANLIRLTELEDEILALLGDGSLSAGHGKALLSAPAGGSRVKLANRAVREGWSVRRLETEAGGEGARQVTGAGKDTGVPAVRPEIADLERRLGEHLGSRVRIATRGAGHQGELRIAFFDLDHFDGLLSRMGYRDS